LDDDRKSYHQLYAPFKPIDEPIGSNQYPPIFFDHTGDRRPAYVVDGKRYVEVCLGAIPSEKAPLLHGSGDVHRFLRELRTEMTDADFVAFIDRYRVGISPTTLWRLGLGPEPNLPPSAVQETLEMPKMPRAARDGRKLPRWHRVPIRWDDLDEIIRIAKTGWGWYKDALNTDWIRSGSQHARSTASSTGFARVVCSGFHNGFTSLDAEIRAATDASAESVSGILPPDVPDWLRPVAIEADSKITVKATEKVLASAKRMDKMLPEGASTYLRIQVQPGGATTYLRAAKDAGRCFVRDEWRQGECYDSDDSEGD
jgi:hypothetical protein